MPPVMPLLISRNELTELRNAAQTAITAGAPISTSSSSAHAPNRPIPVHPPPRRPPAMDVASTNKEGMPDLVAPILKAPPAKRASQPESSPPGKRMATPMSKAETDQMASGLMNMSWLGLVLI